MQLPLPLSMLVPHRLKSRFPKRTVAVQVVNVAMVEAHATRRWLGGLLLALVLTAWAWLPWLDPHVSLWQGEPGVDDAKNHMLRLYVLDWLVARGAWYPRWMPDLFLGYGYPVLNYYAPGFYYAALIIKRLLGLDVWDAYRVTGVFASIIGAAGAYVLVAAVWRRVSLAIFASVTLLYSPYAFQVNLHKRGDIPEVLGLALIPWLLFAIWRVWQAPSQLGALRWSLFAAATGASAILVHNLTALMTAAIAAIWLAYLGLRRPILYRLNLVLLAGALAAGTSAFFWLPALGESHAVQLEWLRDEGLDYRRWFLNPSGNSFRQETPENRQTRSGVIDLHLQYPHQLVAPPMISLGQAGLAVFCTVSIILAALSRRAFGAALTLLLIAAGCWLLTLSVSEPIWRVTPGLPLMQFPWRFLGPVSLCLAIAAAGSLAGPFAALERRWPRHGQKVGRVLALVAGTFFVVNSLGAREFPLVEQPNRIVDAKALAKDELLDQLSMGTTSGREFLPRDVYLATYTGGAPRGRTVLESLYPEGDWSGGWLLPLGGELRITGWRAGPTWISARIANDAAEIGELGIRQARFPGWRAWVDGRSVSIGLSPHIEEEQANPGFMVVSIPPGEHTVSLAFGPTPIRLLAIAVSVGSAMVLASVAGFVLWRGSRWSSSFVVAGWLMVLSACLYVSWRSVSPSFERFAVTAPPANQSVDGKWMAPDLHVQGSGLLVNLAEATRTGAARVESPSGAALGIDKFVDVRHLTITDVAAPQRGKAGITRRQWLYMHPPATVSVDLRVPAQQRVTFQSALTLDPHVWSTPVGDGVQFRATVSRLSTDRQSIDQSVVLDQIVNPRAQTEQRRWLPVEVDLSRWGGSDIRLSLSMLPRDDLSYDWAGWGDPVVAVRDTARAPLTLMESLSWHSG